MSSDKYNTQHLEINFNSIFYVENGILKNHYVDKKVFVSLDITPSHIIMSEYDIPEEFNLWKRVFGSTLAKTQNLTDRMRFNRSQMVWNTQDVLHLFGRRSLAEIFLQAKQKNAFQTLDQDLSERIDSPIIHLQDGVVIQLTYLNLIFSRRVNDFVKQGVRTSSQVFTRVRIWFETKFTTSYYFLILESSFIVWNVIATLNITQTFHECDVMIWEWKKNYQKTLFLAKILKILLKICFATNARLKRDRIL